MQWPDPAGEQIQAYQALHAFDCRSLRSDALGFVATKAQDGFELHTFYSEATPFEIRCKGVRVLAVENASPRVVIRIPTDALWRAPNIGYLHANFRRWLSQSPSSAWLLVAPDTLSWFESRLRGVLGRVPRTQRCGLDATVDPHRS